MGKIKMETFDDIFSKARDVLREVFGFTDLRPGQQIVLKDILLGKDVVAIMPTGSGKSLLYQLPATLAKGTVLVISPLLSLMKDQVDSMRRKGVKAAFINSTLSPGEKKTAITSMANGRYDLVYIAPERFQDRDFQAALTSSDISMLAVDEAHCISQWGHDFRPDYLKIKDIREMLNFPQTIALTATATKNVRQEIALRLGLLNWSDHVAGFDRDNLLYAVSHVSGQKGKLQRIVEVYRDWKGSGIVYASTRKNVENVTAKLRGAGVHAACYHAGMAHVDRQRVQDAFMRGEVPVIVATNAFGMGVDKADIRFVVHFDIPASIESYYQETGRAGRDGKKSYCCLLFNYADTRVPRFFIEEAHPPADLVKKVLDIIANCKATPEVEELVSVLHVSSAMTIRYSLAMLEKSGLITPLSSGGWQYDPGTENKAKLSDLLKLDRQRKKNDEEKLQQMIRYSYNVGCRRLWILDYFGDNNRHDQCNACDNCDRSGLMREVTGKKLLEILKALSAVARLEGRAGKIRFAQVLVGSKAAPVLRQRMQHIPTYGALSYMTQARVCDLLENLISAGYIQVRLKSGKYPLLYLTRSGREVMMQRQACYLSKDSFPPGKSDV